MHAASASTGVSDAQMRAGLPGNPSAAAPMRNSPFDTHQNFAPAASGPLASASPPQASPMQSSSAVNPMRSARLGRAGFDTVMQAPSQPSNAQASAPTLEQTPSPFATQADTKQKEKPSPPQVFHSVSPFTTQAEATQSAAASLANKLTVRITRLLDMPVKQGRLYGPMPYRVRVYDSEMREITHTYEISPPLASNTPNLESETIDVPQDVGVLVVQTLSKYVWVEVDFVDLLGSDPIGRCKIHRLDPRSKQVWPYVLSDQHGRPRNSGIELQLIEPPRGESSPSNSAASLVSFASPPLVPPAVPVIPVAMQAMAPIAPSPVVTPPPLESRNGLVPPVHPPMPPAPVMPLAPGGLPSSGPPTNNHSGMYGLVGVIKLQSIKDIPVARDQRMTDIRVAVSTEMGMGHKHSVELKSVGPFRAKPSGNRREQLLASVDCGATVLTVKAPLRFGGEYQDGAMDVVIRVSYVAEGSRTEDVGYTTNIAVKFAGVDNKYYELKFPGRNQVLGGIFVSHRLVQEADLEHMGIQSVGAAMPQPDLVGDGSEPADVPFNVSGRTGNWPPFSAEEAMEWATINTEVQNRALLQRIKRRDPDSHDESGLIRNMNGYRAFADLDAVFSTMGPNPLIMSDTVGATCARGYQEITSIAEESGPRIGKCRSPHDLAINWNVLQQLYRDDPMRPVAHARPVVCRNPDDILANRDMRWLPDPPAYIPMRNFSPEDIETLRLSSYDPSQSAQLMFADVNPDYQIRQDIWGVQHSYKTHGGPAVTVPPRLRKHRIKDECPIA